MGAGGRYAAMLRGVNVGGRNTLPMASLARLFEEAGCVEVATYIQSGNVAFGANPRRVKTLAAEIAGAIEREFGFASPVILRSHAELAAVVANNPFLPTAAVERLHVAFLAHEPTPAARDSLDPARSPPDEFTVRGRDIYLHLPNGVGRSRLTNDWFDRRLSTTSTLRNWRTVQKLLDLTA